MIFLYSLNQVEIFQLVTEPVNVTSIVPTSPRIETRVRHNICAQFRGGGFAIVKFWHCSDQFCAGSQFYSDPDKIWWPDLCVKCFPKEGTTNTSPLNEHSRFSIREQERREKLEQREKLDKLAKLLENREKASYEEFKALRNTKPSKCGSSRSSIFSSGYRQSQQEKQLNKNFNNQTSSRTTYTGNNKTTYGQFIHQQNIYQEKQQNIHQNYYLDTRHNKNIEENVCQNVRQNIHQNTYQNIHQNIQQNKQKQQNINKNKEENVFKNKQQNKQPKPVNKCFSVQKKLNIENIENSTTTSSSTLKIINNVEVDEEQNNNNDVYSSNNSLLNETLEIRTSESSDENIGNEQHKQKQQPFFGDNFNHQKAEIEKLDDNLIAEEFSSLKVSDTQTTKQQVVDEGEPGGFGYSRRRRFAFELKTNLEQQQKIKEGNSFQKFQFNKNIGKENLRKIRGNKNKGGNNEDNFVIDEALNAVLSDEDRNEKEGGDKYNDNEDVFEYDEEGVEDVEEEEEEEYADYSSNVSG
uniref:Uncharacterized protein n=1 Tax=Meloidogyne javanica TaxID=6303 RepID=A0A915N1U1_MELJA